MGTGLEFDFSDEESHGIVPRVIHSLFDTLIQKRKRNESGYKFQVHVSFLELYNEELIDLLNVRRPRSAGLNTANVFQDELAIKDDGNGNIIWIGVKEEKADSPDELLRFTHLLFLNLFI